MSRRRTKPEEIKNKNHYFKRYVAKEALHDHIMQNDYESMNVSFEQTLESKDRVVNSERLLMLAANESGELFDAYLAERSVQSWLECISNPEVHKALKQLTEIQQNILYLRYYHMLSQRETAEMLHSTQQCVSKQERAAKRKIKIFLKGGCEKR